MQGMEINVNVNVAARATLRLYTIAADLIPVLLSGNPGESPLPGFIELDQEAKVFRLYDVADKLIKWRKELPSEISLEDGREQSNVAGPVVDLQYV